MENPIKMDDLGVPLFSETSNWNLGSMNGLPGSFKDVFFSPTVVRKMLNWIDMKFNGVETTN